MGAQFIRKTAREIAKFVRNLQPSTGGLQVHPRAWLVMAAARRVHRQGSVRALRGTVTWDGDLEESRAN
jgi:hypothetical protein